MKSARDRLAWQLLKHIVKEAKECWLELPPPGESFPCGLETSLFDITDPQELQLLRELRAELGD